VARRDPLANPPELIRRVYSYVAYRIGDGPDAEDVTSDVFERALRYRDSYDPARGEPLSWLLGIARRCVNAALQQTRIQPLDARERASTEDLEAQAVERMTVASAIERLDERSQDLVALRYGADLTARQIAAVLGLKTNAVEVALHRTLARLRPELEADTRVAPGTTRETTSRSPEFVDVIRDETG
jgi:RNA polymerase sigma-70 factor, ECF subfamily